MAQTSDNGTRVCVDPRVTYVLVTSANKMDGLVSKMDVSYTDIHELNDASKAGIIAADIC
jgi:hypothetical protein